MKPVSKAIIYDSSCPMCQAYTKGFVKWGLLADEHRIAFCELQPAQASRYLDLQRSRHEIPLVDLAGGETLYGVDALVHLLSQRLPWIGILMNNSKVYNAFKKLYSFVSYNRRVITATATTGKGVDCAPDYHLGYRVRFLVFAILMAGIITWGLGQSAEHYFPALNGANMLLICGTGWFFQSVVVVGLVKSQLRIEYLGQLAVLMLIGTLVLLPGMAVNALTGHTSPGWLLGSVAISSILMHTEHFRRIKYLNISQLWMVLWSAALLTTACFWLYQFLNK